MYLESAVIKNFLNSGIANLTPAIFTHEISRFLESLPWSVSGAGLDWDKIPSKYFSIEDIYNSVSQTVFRDDCALVFFFSSSESCIACDPEFGMKHVDEIFWQAPGYRYVFGASIEDGELKLNLEHFAEYDGREKIRVRAL